MHVKVLFFGATAETVGKREINLVVEKDNIARNVFDGVLDQHPGLRSHKLLFAINKNYATGNEPVCDGDELAVFTAVSGG